MKSFHKELWFDVLTRRVFINITTQGDALAFAACEFQKATNYRELKNV